jgi:hypothetical protein
VGLEVVLQLAPREHYRVEQLLDLRIPRLGLKQHLADVVYKPLDWEGVPFLRTLYHDDRADHLGGCGNIEIQRLTILGRRKDRRVSEHRLEFVECLLGFDGPGKTPVLLQEPVEGQDLFAELRDEAAQGGKAPQHLLDPIEVSNQVHPVEGRDFLAVGLDAPLGNDIP